MRELHGFKAHHRVVLGCGERLGGGGSTEQGGSAAEANDGEVTPVEDGRREVARELREREAKLFGRSGSGIAGRRRGGARRRSSGAAALFWGMGARRE